MVYCIFECNFVMTFIELDQLVPPLQCAPVHHMGLHHSGSLSDRLSLYPSASAPLAWLEEVDQLLRL